MLQVPVFALEELLRERREGAVRSLIRAIGYVLARGGGPEELGQFLFDSFRMAGEFRERVARAGVDNGAAFAAWHIRMRWGWCDDVRIRAESGGYLVESASMLHNHEAVLSFHGVTRLDVETCMERFWQLSGRELGLETTYTVGDDRDWAIIRPAGGSTMTDERVELPLFSPQSLAEYRRMALASGITASIGLAKHKGDEPEDLGHFFYAVWDRAGHYERLRERWGYGNALAYSQSLMRSRQVLYTQTELTEDLDGYLISSPSWATEIPHVMGTFGVLPDDVYRYYEGGGLPACARLGLQYADRSEDRVHRVWIRSR